MKSLLIVLITVIFVSGAAYSETESENRQKLEKINAEIKERINKQYKLYSEEKNILFQIQRFDDKIEGKRKDVSGCNSRQLEVENSINALRKQLGYSSNEMVKIEDDLKKRVVQVYCEGKYKNLKMLVSAVSFQDFVKKYNFVLLLAKRDVELKRKYMDRKNSYNSTRKSLEARYDYYEKIKKETKAKEDELLAEKEEKNKLLQDIKSKKDLHEQAIGELRVQSSKLEALVNAVEKETKGEVKVDVSDLNGDINKYKGKLPYPVKGKIVSGFGKFKHPKFNAFTNNNGIEIAVKQDQEVTAVFSGVVLFADWFKGYGKMVLVDCGNNIVIIYGHFSEIGVNVGQKVKAKQVLGKGVEIGTTDVPTLYVEVRKEGKPENPVDWFEKTK